MVTDYTTIILMAVKLLFGFYYMKSLFFPGQKDEEFILDEHGDEKFKARIMSQ